MKKSSNKNSRDNNFLTAKRIEEIMSELGYKKNIDQKNFAHDIDVLPQNFSRFMNSGKESTYYCKKIVKAFPQYNLAWLLGYSDLKTWNDWAEDIQHKKDLTADSMWGVFENSLNKQGKSLRFVHRSGQHVDSSQRLRADCYYSIVDSDGNELKRLTALDMVKLEQKLQEYCDFLTFKYL
jgi:hypothetical protein